MNVLKSLWASVEVSPRFLLVAWTVITLVLIPWTILLLPPMPLAELGKQVWYVTLISHVALILSGISAIQAARVEVRQEDQETKKREEFDQEFEELIFQVKEILVILQKK